MEYSFIFVYIPCPTFEEASKIATELLDKKLADTITIHRDSELFYKEKEVEHETINVLVINTHKENLQKIRKYIKKNHSWGTPCINVTPNLADYC